MPSDHCTLHKEHSPAIIEHDCETNTRTPVTVIDRNESNNSETVNTNGVDETKNEVKVNYLQNIQLSNTNGLILEGKKGDESTLTKSKTVLKFSPIWKQVYFVCIK